MPSLTSIVWSLALAVAPRTDPAAPSKAPPEEPSAGASAEERDAPFERSEPFDPAQGTSQGFEAPLEGGRLGPPATSHDDRAAAPLEDAARPADPSQGSLTSTPLSPETAPFRPRRSGSTTLTASEPDWAAPLGAGPTLPAPVEPDLRTIRLVRFNVQTGVVLRLQRLEPLISANVEFGHEQGVSASFHTSMIVAPDRNFIRVHDFPIGVGVLARGRARKRPLYGSVGLSAGILLHRANTDIGLIHRVDPDLQLPLRGTWTPRGGKNRNLGLSIALVQGWSVRRRSYERRGLTVWSRYPYRIGIVLGLHFDIRAGRTRPRRSGDPKGRDHDNP